MDEPACLNSFLRLVEKTMGDFIFSISMRDFD
ncbi:hypothetical protein BFZC1_14193 [Lysinibacillus fusiformis ZC1]|nr:hypothetical protein BFZC1_14193 [Lysinibacillus fusiformis ZC1]